MPLARKSANRVHSVARDRHNGEQQVGMGQDGISDREQIHDRWHVKRLLTDEGEQYYWELSATNGEVIARIPVNLLLDPNESGTK
jgi:hypothetical protein